MLYYADTKFTYRAFRYCTVCWALQGDFTNVQFITDWPASPERTLDSVPIIITYAEDGQPRSWGFSAVRAAESSIDVRFIGLRILLEVMESGSTTRGVHEQMKRVGVTIDKVTADYLRFVWQHTKAKILESLPDYWKTLCNFQVTMTAPDSWDLEKRPIFYSAAFRAGIPDTLRVIRESEAGLMYSVGSCRMLNATDIIFGSSKDELKVWTMGGFQTACSTWDIRYHDMKEKQPTTIFRYYTLENDWQIKRDIRRISLDDVLQAFENRLLQGSTISQGTAFDPDMYKEISESERIWTFMEDIPAWFDNSHMAGKFLSFVRTLKHGCHLQLFPLVKTPCFCFSHITDVHRSACLCFGALIGASILLQRMNNEAGSSPAIPLTFGIGESFRYRLGIPVRKPMGDREFHADIYVDRRMVSRMEHQISWTKKVRFIMFAPRSLTYL